MAKEIGFKKALVGGFKKEDVLNYIDSMNRSSVDAQTFLKGQIQHLTVSREKLSKRVSAFEDRLLSIEQQLTQKQDIIRDLSRSESKAQDDLLQMAQKLETVQTTLAARDTEIFNKARQYRELESKIDAYKERADRYDAMAASVGEVLVAAKNQAEETVRIAEQEAHNILSAARGDGRIIAEESFGLMEDMKAEMETFRIEVDTLRTALRQTTALADARIEKISEAVDATLNRLTHSNQSLDEKINGSLQHIWKEPIDLKSSAQKESGALCEDEDEAITAQG